MTVNSGDNTLKSNLCAQSLRCNWENTSEFRSKDSEAGEMSQRLGVLAVFTEEQNCIHSTYIKSFTSTYDCNARGSAILFCCVWIRVCRELAMLNSLDTSCSGTGVHWPCQRHSYQLVNIQEFFYFMNLVGVSIAILFFFGEHLREWYRIPLYNCLLSSRHKCFGGRLCMQPEALQFFNQVW